MTYNIVNITTTGSPINHTISAGVTKLTLFGTASEFLMDGAVPLPLSVPVTFNGRNLPGTVLTVDGGGNVVSILEISEAD